MAKLKKRKVTKTLVLFNGKEYTYEELIEAKKYAIKQYYAAEKRKNNAQIRMNECTNIISSLEGRIRLLKMI